MAAAETEVAQRVDDMGAFVLLCGLDDMRVVADDEVGPGIYQPMGGAHAPRLGVVSALGSAVVKDDLVIGVFCFLFDPLDDVCCLSLVPEPMADDGDDKAVLSQVKGAFLRAVFEAGLLYGGDGVYIAVEAVVVGVVVGQAYGLDAACFQDIAVVGRRFEPENATAVVFRRFGQRPVCEHVL